MHLNFLRLAGIDNMIKYCLFLAIILSFIIFSSVFSRIVIFIFHKVFRIRSSSFRSSLYKPVRWFFVITGFYIAFGILDFSIVSRDIVWKIYKVLIVVDFCAFGIRSLDGRSTLFRKMKLRVISNDVFSDLVKIFIFVLSVMIVFSEFGYDLTGIFIFMGLFSVAFGIGLKYYKEKE